jgi:hypothetical protein
LVAVSKVRVDAEIFAGLTMAIARSNTAIMATGRPRFPATRAFPATRDYSDLVQIASCCLVFTSLAAMVVLAFQRGPWLDEFWTVWMAEPTLSLGEAYAQRWSTDLHPPLYYASVWLFRQGLGDEIAWLRFVNVLPLLPLLPSVYLWLRNTRRDTWLAIFAVLVASCPYTIANFAELRSYFAIIALTAALVIQLKLFDREHELAPRERRWLRSLIAITILISLNVHFLSSAIIAARIGLEMLRTLLRRNWSGLAVLAIPSAIGALVLTITFALQMGRTEFYTFYPATFLDCVIIVGAGVALGLVLNPGVDLAIARTLLRQRADALRGAGWSLAALAIGALGILVYSTLSGSLTLRYTFVLTPLAADVAAELAKQALAQSRVQVLLFVLGAIALQLFTVVHESANKRWLLLADQIAAITRQCPGTQVIGIDQHALHPDNEQRPVSGWIGVFDSGYRWVAARHGFTVETTGRDADTMARASRCPTLVWAEHDFADISDPFELVGRARIRFEGGTPQLIEQRRLPHQQLLVFRNQRSGVADPAAAR